MTKFHYRLIGVDPRNGLAVYRPIIPLFVAHDGRMFGYEALIDSGADRCHFHGELAELLGIKVENGERREFLTIGNHICVAFFHSVTLRVANKVYVARCGFSYDLGADGFGVLGQDGFFNVFDVKFSLRKKEVALTS